MTALATPRTGALGALLSAPLCAAAHGAAGALLPYVKFNAIVLTFAVLVPAILFSRLDAPRLRALLLALAAGALANLAMWGVWFGLEEGWDRLSQLLASGPRGIWKTLHQMAATTTLSIAFDSGPQVVTPLWVGRAWVAQTAVIGLAPLVGALMIRRPRSARA